MSLLQYYNKETKTLTLPFDFNIEWEGKTLYVGCTLMKVHNQLKAPMIKVSVKINFDPIRKSDWELFIFYMILSHKKYTYGTYCIYTFKSIAERRGVDAEPRNYSGTPCQL